jgi:tRNA dimethylallyltransferase
MSRFSDFSKEAEPGQNSPLVLLAGPTASGKTSLSIELSTRISAEIVNADSMQLYRHMEIGTAKPTLEQRRLVPHHLLDAADPDEPFDAAKYLHLARPVIEDIKKRGKVPLVVGGAGLYMRVLTRGICPGPSSDPELKEKLIADEKSKGLRQLYCDLARIDPESAARIHPNDRQRILRSLEVFGLTGVPLSVLQKGHGFKEQLFPAIRIFINREREVLYERINRRVDLMIESGLKAEVEKLLGMGYTAQMKSMQSLGYKQMSAHISGAISLDEAARQIKRETRRYAKRQITWFQGDHEFRSFDADDIDGIFRYVMQELSGSNRHAFA